MERAQPAEMPGADLMDSMRGIERVEDHDLYHDDIPAEAPPPAIGNDERRMHVRAYNYWVSLLNGRPYPSIRDLDPASIDDFGPNSVLLDFTGGIENPGVAWLGKALREECGLDAGIASIADVPSRSLLSRLTDHYLQIIANKAPIGFEAEFTSHRGQPSMYRGILMPFSSDSDSIDFVYGVINWKEVATAHITDDLAREVDQALRTAPRPAANVAPVWADGPHASPVADAVAGFDEEEPALNDDAGLWDWLAAARDSAEAARQCDGRSRAALYAALGRAHDFALAADADPDSYAELLEEEGLTFQARAPMTPIVKLVFGADYDKTRLTEYAAALSFARREGLERGALPAFLDTYAGGLKAVVKAERAFRAPAKVASSDIAREALRSAAPKAVVSIETGEEEFVLLVGRRIASGQVALLAAVHDEGLIDRAIRKAA